MIQRYKIVSSNVNFCGFFMHYTTTQFGRVCQGEKVLGSGCELSKSNKLFNLLI